MIHLNLGPINKPLNMLFRFFRFLIYACFNEVFIGLLTTGGAAVPFSTVVQSCTVVNSDEKFYYQKNLIIVGSRNSLFVNITGLTAIHGCIMILRKIMQFAFITWRTYQKWQQRKTKNQHTHRSDLKIGKRHPSGLKITKTVNAIKKQQHWQLSFTGKSDLCKTGNDFTSKNEERYNHFGRFTEAEFL